MAQRIAACMAVLHEPELLLLDEPDSHLDAEARELVGALTGPAAGRTRVLVSHERERALGEADAGAGALRTWTRYLALLGKDLRVELRTLRSLPAMALFAVTTFVIFRFGLDRTELEGGLAAGVLVATLLFAAILAINRLFVAEREEGGFELIRLAPLDRTVLFAAKVVGAVHLPVRAGAGRGADLRALLPRLGGRRWRRWCPCCCWPTRASPSRAR